MIRLIIKSLWRFYHLINIKDSRYIRGKVMSYIEAVGRMRLENIGCLVHRNSQIYANGLSGVENKSTYLTYMLLTEQVDKDLVNRLVTHGGVLLKEIESIFISLNRGVDSAKYNDLVFKKSFIVDGLSKVSGVDLKPDSLSTYRDDIRTRTSYYEEVFSKLNEDLNYLYSIDKKLSTAHQHDLVLDRILTWADIDYWSTLGDVNCRVVNTLTLSRPPEITTNEDLLYILDLLSRIAMILRDSLYILDSSDTIIKYIAARFHNDEYRHVTQAVINFNRNY